MNLFEAILLGIIQGITEFLPVSSSAHLVIVQNILGFKEPELLFDLVLHIGTLLATVLIFRKEIIRLFMQPRALLLIIVAGIPTGIIGMTLFHQIEQTFGSMKIASGCLLVTGSFLWLTKKIPEKSITLEGPLFSFITIPKAFLIGLAQGIAILPGISRSGATITTALILKSGRRDAATFSFLLSIPSILGALALKIYKTPHLQIPDANPFIIGFLFSLVFGTLSLMFLIKILMRGEFFKFSYYCWALGIGGLLAAYTFL